MAINKWGVMPQAQMACEECGELIQAISKCFFRGKGVEKSGIVSELADVTIMIEQLTQILGVSEEVEAEKRRKQERLLNRILDQ
jgi:NTP pyrophosphatase (non-canonical NTP hydrolase)